MKETLNYIKVLNWGYGAFCGSFGDIAPLTLSPDFHSSIGQLEKRLALLEQLCYDALLVEATSDNGKANLKKYKSTGTTFEYQLRFMRDREQVLGAFQSTFKGFKDYIYKFWADGLWADEQWRECRWTLDEIERLFKERLEQFATAYDFEQEQQPKPQQVKQEQPQDLPTIRNTDKERLVFGNAIKKQYMSLEDGCYKWTLSKRLLAYMCGRLYCKDRVKEEDYEPKLNKCQTPFPEREAKDLFGGVNVANNRRRMKDPPRNYWWVDDLFKNDGASK